MTGHFPLRPFSLNVTSVREGGPWYARMTYPQIWGVGAGRCYRTLHHLHVHVHVQLPSFFMDFRYFVNLFQNNQKMRRICSQKSVV
jgi:hypothetical protein